jgi:hypothetical protein
MRLSISFEGKAKERLDKLTAGGESKADVLRQALALEELYQEASKRGANFYLKEPDGTIKELVRV